MRESARARASVSVSVCESMDAIQVGGRTGAHNLIQREKLLANLKGSIHG